MKNLTRNDLRIFSDCVHLSEADVDRALREHIYNDRSSWQRFLRFFLLSLGFGLAVAGIIFFFAYNWADLNKFAKLGLTEGLMLATCCLVLFLKVSATVRNILLTAASVLVGAMFAVYGQIYQTGADAYDFFLGWTLFATLWVIVSDFPPLWLFYIILINTTVLLYLEQAMGGEAWLFTVTLLFVLNTVFAIAAIMISMFRKGVAVPNWFTNVLVLASVAFATTGILTIIFENDKGSPAFLLVATAVVYAMGVNYGIRNRRPFYLAVIPFSLIVIVAGLLIKTSVGMDMLLVVSVFIIGSVTLLIKAILGLQKKWIHAN